MMAIGSSMFWHIVRRLLTANYGRLFVILLALGAGAAVTSALLNLQIDAKRRFTSEFRALGANVIVAPPAADGSSAGVTTSLAAATRQAPSKVAAHTATLDENILAAIRKDYEGKPVPAAEFLYVVAEARKAGALPGETAVIAGVRGVGLQEIRPAREIESSPGSPDDPGSCEIGEKISSRFQIHPGQVLLLRNEGREASCKIRAVIATGSAEDSQIFVPLTVAQNLARLPGRISLVQLSVTGTPVSIERFIGLLSANLEGADVHAIRQFTEGEARLYNHISGLLTYTVVFVLVLTALCVMAGMSNVAMERKNDVGLMKAIGGSVSSIVRLFLAEAIVMGLIGGVVGSAIGLLASLWLGQAVFGVAAQPRWIVYPFSVALTVIVSIASAYPLRHLAGVRPASVFRGEA
jgi:putative ABC transport system permease protein